MKGNSGRLQPISAYCTFILFATISGTTAQTLVLQRSFIEKYKNRATIEGTFIVDHAHKQPNAPKNDGDLHASGRSDAVGLPMVAEVMNARESTQKDVLQAIHENEGKGSATPIAGAWRIWFEHPSTTKPQVQFDTVPLAENTNPDHCFEIHPITEYSGSNILASLHQISGFTPKDAEAAFDQYEKLKATLRIADDNITITSKKVGFNYVGFVAEIAGKPERLDDNDSGTPDGQAVLATVLKNSGDEVLVDNLRLIFIAGTQAEAELAKASEGVKLDLIALPRLDLSAISALASDAGSGNFVRKLPYEMIVVSAHVQE